MTNSVLRQFSVSGSIRVTYASERQFVVKTKDQMLPAANIQPISSSP